MWFSLDYVVGPLIGGHLSDSTINDNSVVRLKAPCSFVAGIAILNIVILPLAFQANKIGNPTDTFNWINPSHSFLEAVKINKVCTYSLLLLMLLGWNTFFQFIGLFLTPTIGFSQQKVLHFVPWVRFGLTLALVAPWGLEFPIVE